MALAMPTIAPARAARVLDRLAESRTPAPVVGDRAEFLAELQGCTRCPLAQSATQAVPGEGPPDAALMIVGEQPGDHEDLAGRPFVGPAGQLFDRLAADAGLDRARAYVTNAVKHFKFQPRGKRRLHQAPNQGEIDHCRWWLDIERRLIRPRLLVAMGATATYSLTGDKSGLLTRRGGVEPGPDDTPVLITLHPSYILRLPDDAARQKAREDLTSDLARAVELVRQAA
jgi:DNA polymerase